MTVVSGETEIEAIESLDFEYAPPCESIEGCDYEAEWALTLKCCGDVILLCEQCKEYVRMFCNLWVGMECGACGNVWGNVIVIKYEKL